MTKMKPCDGKSCGEGKHVGGGYYLCPHRNLLILHPELSEEWNYEENEKGPQDYTPGSKKVVAWICKVNNNHRWKDQIGHRVSGRGCPEGCGTKNVARNTETMKICTECNTSKSLEKFSKSKDGRLGRAAKCRECLGVIRREKGKTLDRFMLMTLARARTRAKRNLAKGRTKAGVCDLTKADLIALWGRQNGKCYYSGITMSPRACTNWLCSLERLDNHQGYIADNVVFACLEFNTHIHWTLDKIKRIQFLVRNNHDDSELMAKINQASNKPKAISRHRNQIITNDMNYYSCNRCNTFKPITEFGNRINSGCTKCQIIYKTAYRNTIRGHLKSLLKCSRRRSIDRDNVENRVADNSFDITFEILVELLRSQRGRCAYSNIKLNYGHATRKDWVASLERIDPGKGYTKDNICLVCAEFNGTDCTTNIKYSNGGSGNWSKEKFSFFLSHLKNQSL